MQSLHLVVNCILVKEKHFVPAQSTPSISPLLSQATLSICLLPLNKAKETTQLHPCSTRFSMIFINPFQICNFALPSWHYFVKFWYSFLICKILKELKQLEKKGHTNWKKTYIYILQKMRISQLIWNANPPEIKKEKKKHNTITRGRTVCEVLKLTHQYHWMWEKNHNFKEISLWIPVCHAWTVTS